MTDSDETKRCPQCDQTKPLGAFNRSAAAKSGRASWCRQCASAAGAEYRQRQCLRAEAIKARLSAAGADQTLLALVDPKSLASMDRMEAIAAEAERLAAEAT